MDSELSSQISSEDKAYFLAEAVENMLDGFHLWHLENLDDAHSFRLQLANPAAAQLLAVDDVWALGKSMD